MVYTFGLDHVGKDHGRRTSGVARVFWNGRSQAVRLPRDFRLPGDRVRVRHAGQGVLLEPILDLPTWFQALDQFGPELFPDDRRDQPETPRRDAFE